MRSKYLNKMRWISPILFHCASVIDVFVFYLSTKLVGFWAKCTSVLDGVPFLFNWKYYSTRKVIRVGSKRLS